MLDILYATPSYEHDFHLDKKVQFLLIFLYIWENKSMKIEVYINSNPSNRKANIEIKLQRTIYKFIMNSMSHIMKALAMVYKSTTLKPNVLI